MYDLGWISLRTDASQTLKCLVCHQYELQVGFELLCHNITYIDFSKIFWMCRLDHRQHPIRSQAVLCGTQAGSGRTLFHSALLCAWVTSLSGLTFPLTHEIVC